MARCRASPAAAPSFLDVLVIDRPLAPCRFPPTVLFLARRSLTVRVLGAAEQSDQPERAQLSRLVCLGAVARARLSSTFGRARLAPAPSESRVSLEYLGGPVPRVRGAALLDGGTAPIPSTHRPALVRGPVPFSGRAVTRDLVRVALGPSPATSHVATQLHVAARLRPLPHLAARPTPTVLSYYVTSPLLSRSLPVAQAVLGSWALPNKRMNRSAHSRVGRPRWCSRARPVILDVRPLQLGCCAFGTMRQPT